MSCKTTYSHAYLIGHLPDEKINVNLQDGWQRKTLVNEGDKDDATSEFDIYEKVCRFFYPSHVDAMQETPNSKRPKFLRAVHHYQCSMDREVSLPIKYTDLQAQQCVDATYKFTIVALHIYQFPLGINFFAIEIDDTGNDLNCLTSGHDALMRWDKVIVKRLTDALVPLSRLVDGGLENLLQGQNKLKLYQVVMIEGEAVDDKVLYEIATSSPIGSTQTVNHFKPSDSYFNEVMSNHSVSAYDNWKALALNDSLTYLMINNCPSDSEKARGSIQTWLHSYFPLIYLRCLLEKTFCFTRNNAYRSDHQHKKLIGEIAEMERYYFYDNISYNFLPNMLYKAIKKGMETDLERKELTEQVKERESTWMTIVMAAIATFAILSVFSDAWTLLDNSLGWFVVALVVVIALWIYLSWRNRV